MGLKAHYRGVPFSVDPAGERQWRWTAHHRGEGHDPLSGELTGTQTDALGECFRAINTALDKNNLR